MTHETSSAPRNELSHTFRLVTIWLLIGVVVFLSVQWMQRDGLRSRISVDGGNVEIRRGPDGHYHWAGRVGNDGKSREVDFLIDTGATRSAISAELARALNLEVLGATRSETANGSVRGETVRADITLHGGVRAERLVITALPNMGEFPLLGMDVLGKLRWTQRDGVLRFELDAKK